MCFSKIIYKLYNKLQIYLYLHFNFTTDKCYWISVRYDQYQQFYLEHWPGKKISYVLSLSVLSLPVVWNLILLWSLWKKNMICRHCGWFFFAMVMASWRNWEKVAKIKCFATPSCLTNAILPLILTEGNSKM